MQNRPLNSQVSNRAGISNHAHPTCQFKLYARGNDIIFHVSAGLLSVHVTGIAHEVRAFRRALAHKRVRVVLLIKMVRAQSALFGLSPRQARAWARELIYPADSAGPPNSQARSPTLTRYPALADTDSAYVDMITPVVNVAAGN